MSRYVIEPRKRAAARCWVILDKQAHEVLGRYTTREKAERVLAAMEWWDIELAERPPKPVEVQSDGKCAWCGK